MELLKIAGICISCAVIAKLIAQTNKEISAAVSISAVAVCSYIILNSLCEVISNLNTILSFGGLDIGYLNFSFKALGICYVSELASSSCRDCGETALAGIIDISGKVAIALMCIPLLDKLLEVIKTILEN